MVLVQVINFILFGTKDQVMALLYFSVHTCINDIDKCASVKHLSSEIMVNLISFL